MLPEPTSVTIAQAREIADRVERWAALTDDVDALADAQAKLGAIEAYLRRRHEQGAVEIARADRRLEVRIGVLLGPPRQGERTDLSHASDKSLSKDTRHRFRQMAAHADRPEVAEAIEQGASQSEVLRAIKGVRQAETEAALGPIIEAQLAEDRAAIAEMNRVIAKVSPPEEQVLLTQAFYEAVNGLIDLPEPAEMVGLIPAYSAHRLDRIDEATSWLVQFSKEWNDQ